MADALKYMIPVLNRAFQEWHERVRDDLAVRIYPTYSVRGIKFSILGVHDTLVWGEIFPHTLSVLAGADGRVFDCLFHVFGRPAALGNSYVEHSFVEDGAQDDLAEAPKFATKAELWEHYLFERLARWLQEDYVPSTVIEYRAWGRGRERMRYAELCREPKPEEPGVASLTIDLHHQHYMDMIRSADRAETLDGVDLSGLTPRETLMVVAAAKGDETIGSYDVTGMSDEAFHAFMLSNKPEPPISDAELEAGRILLAARRRPRT